MANFKELIAFIEEAVAADVPRDQKEQNLIDLANEAKAEETLTDAQRLTLLQRIGQYRVGLHRHDNLPREPKEA